MMMDSIVAINLSESFEYPIYPIHPPIIYPDFESSSMLNMTNYQNMVYAKVRNVLRELGLDNSRVDTSNWNPLKELIKKEIESLSSRIW